MQLKELEYLLKTVECGSITKAAEQMFISQPTLTKNIQSLDNEYNIKNTGDKQALLLRHLSDCFLHGRYLYRESGKEYKSNDNGKGYDNR